MKTIDELFAETRFDVEGVLMEAKSMFGEIIPDCPSQKLRALRTLEAIRASKNPKLSQMRGKLEDFLAIHRTIELLNRQPPFLTIKAK